MTKGLSGESLMVPTMSRSSTVDTTTNGEPREAVQQPDCGAAGWARSGGGWLPRARPASAPPRSMRSPSRGPATAPTGIGRAPAGVIEDGLGIREQTEQRPAAEHERRLQAEALAPYVGVATGNGGGLTHPDLQGEQHGRETPRGRAAYSRYGLAGRPVSVSTVKRTATRLRGRRPPPIGLHHPPPFGSGNRRSADASRRHCSRPGGSTPGCRETGRTRSGTRADPPHVR